MTDLINELVAAIEESDLNFLIANKHRFEIDSRITFNDNDTLVMHALTFSTDDVCDFLIENGANLKLVNDEGEGVIHSIVYSGNPNRLESIYSKHKCDLNVQSIDGATPLLLATGLEKYEVFMKLIELKADINLEDNENNTPLHVACSFGRLEFVSPLVENGANLFIKTDKGNFPLAIAVNNEHHEVIKYLFTKIYFSSQ